MAQKKTWSSGAIKPNRSGQRITLDLDPALYQAVAQVAHETGNIPINTTVSRILREWFAGTGQVKAKRQVIPVPPPTKRGPKPGFKRKKSALAAAKASGQATSPMPVPGTSESA